MGKVEGKGENRNITSNAVAPAEPAAKLLVSCEGKAKVNPARRSSPIPMLSEIIHPNAFLPLPHLYAQLALNVPEIHVAATIVEQLHARIVVSVDDVVRKIDEELRETSFCCCVITEDWRKGSVPQGFRETLA